MVDSDIFLQEYLCLKSVNHGRVILELEQPIAGWLRDVLGYSGLVGLCFVAYVTISHGM